MSFFKGNMGLHLITYYYFEVRKWV